MVSKIIRYLFIVCFIALLSATEARAQAAITATLVNPASIPLTTESQWDSFYSNLQALGFDTAIITATGLFTRSPCDGGDLTVVDYLTNPARVPAITQALEHGFDTYIGTLINNNCAGLGSYTNTSLISSYQERHQVQLSNLKTFLSAHQLLNDPHFVGLYLPTETNIPILTSSASLSFHQQLFSQMRGQFPGKSILISPYLHDDIEAAEFANIIKSFASTTHIDIIAPQDLGGGRADGRLRSPQKNAEYFLQTSQATDSISGFSLWGNVETLRYSPRVSGFIPKTIDDLSTYIDAIKPHTVKLMTWIYQYSLAPQDQYPSSNLPILSEDNATRRQNLRDAYQTRYLSLSLPGDLNGDGHVNHDDLTLLISNFGNPYDIFDFNRLVTNYSTQ